MRKLGTYFLLAMAVLWTVVAMGCNPTNKGSGTGGTGGSVAGSGGAVAGSGTGGDGGCLVGCGAGGPGGSGGGQQGGSIIISPMNQSITITNGAITTIPFTATLNGQDITNQVQWLFDHPEIGDVGAGSIFTPTGAVAGLGKLTAKYSNAEGNTDVTVYIKKIVNTGNLPQTTIDLLDNPNGGADNQMSIAYPYPQTVFPLGVLSPEIQWFGGGGGDAYKIHMTEKYYDYTEYFTQSPPGRHIVPQGDWDSLTRSGSGAQSDPLTVAIGRFSGGQAYQPELNTWHVAQGKLKGNIYYWELPDQCGNGNGRILRIKPDAEQVDEFFQPGSCWGCHTVSRDGKTMMATLDTSSPFPQITIDLSQDPAQYAGLKAGATPIGGTFSAFNDKSDKALVSNDGDWAGTTRLRIVDANNGNTLNDNAMGNMCGEPAWSPTGKKIAAICNLSSSSWIFDATGGSLFTADVADDGFTVSNIQQLVPQAGGQGRPAYPSFSPGDGEYIAFGRPTAGSRTTGNGDLWLAETANGANVKKLAIASSDNKSFNPVFSPLRAGGFYWLVFVSRRDYGNHLIGSNRQQLWITAVDDPPTAGDPSHPPFYVRGQEDCAKSENAYFALPPCKDKGMACTEGSDCCNGQCIKDPQTGMYTCGDPPPPGMCSQDGNSCQTSADCCNYNPNDPKGISCIDNFCQYPPPQ
ncbi:MAG: hypothetical protein U0441_19440 [Polyangiaceae bacterium]